MDVEHFSTKTQFRDIFPCEAPAIFIAVATVTNRNCAR
jgi:hypothetical protein